MNNIYLQLWWFGAKELAKWEAACGALSEEYPLPCVSMILSTLLGYSRVRSSPLLCLRPRPKESSPRSRTRYRLMARRWSPGGG